MSTNSDSHGPVRAELLAAFGQGAQCDIGTCGYDAIWKFITVTVIAAIDAKADYNGARRQLTKRFKNIGSRVALAMPPGGGSATREIVLLCAQAEVDACQAAIKNLQAKNPNKMLGKFCPNYKQTQIEECTYDTDEA